MTINDTNPFSVFALDPGVLEALARKGFSDPTPIQALAIPRLLEDGGHLVAKARTGTGKTAAFGIPLAHRLSGPSELPKALVLAPTRELALQVSAELASFRGGPYPRIATIYGGSAFGPQLKALARGVELVVGTPGRVLDHLSRGTLDLSGLEWLVLDEADEMLDMGFLEDVETIMDRAAPDRRVVLFSATMRPPILKIVREKLGQVPIVEDAGEDEDGPAAVDQYYMEIRAEDRLEAVKRIADAADAFHCLIFCATKAETDEVARRLLEAGFPAEALHGDLSQETRERTLRRFRDRRTTVLVATDVAARGIDVERISHVINWELPRDAESYVHRIGRTGRAGRRGVAVSFVGPAGRSRLRTLSREADRVLGSPIVRMRAPTVEELLERAYARTKKELLALAAGEEPEQASGLSDGASAASGPSEGRDGESFSERLASDLIAEVGAAGAVTALIRSSFADRFDGARYGSIKECESRPERQERPVRSGRTGRPERDPVHRDGRSGASTRVYLAYGRRHGADARSVVELLHRAVGVPGRLVDGVDVKDYCAFATLPADAARKAFALARRDSRLPAIRPATDGGSWNGRAVQR